MDDSGAPVGSKPVNVALVMFVGAVRTKSSADSISILPADPGREAVAILPSGFHVLQKKVPADAGAASRATAINTSRTRMCTRINHPCLEKCTDPRSKT